MRQLMVSLAITSEIDISLLREKSPVSFIFNNKTIIAVRTMKCLKCLIKSLKQVPD